MASTTVAVRTLGRSGHPAEGQVHHRAHLEDRTATTTGRAADRPRGRPGRCRSSVPPPAPEAGPPFGPWRPRRADQRNSDESGQTDPRGGGQRVEDRCPRHGESPDPGNRDERYRSDALTHEGRAVRMCDVTRSPYDKNRAAAHTEIGRTLPVRSDLPSVDQSESSQDSTDPAAAAPEARAARGPAHRAVAPRTPVLVHLPPVPAEARTRDRRGAVSSTALRLARRGELQPLRHGVVEHGRTRVVAHDPDSVGGVSTDEPMVWADRCRS